MKTKKTQEPSVIEYDMFCRVGKDWRSGRLFIGELAGIDGKIANKVVEMLGIPPKDLHDLTCVIQKFDTRSIAGTDYLAEKVLRLKLKVVIEECRLVNDLKVKSRPPG